MKRLIALLLMATAAQAGPLREPAQCAVFWRNIEKVQSWTAERKNEMYFQCLARAMDYKAASQLTVEESIKLRDAWALTPPPEPTNDE